MFGALIEESETLQFSELPCANFLCRGSIVYKKVIWEKKKEEKLKISRLFELQFCDLKLSASTVWSSAPKTTHCPSHFHACFCSRVSVLKWNWSCAEQLCSSRLYFLLFLFFVLDQFLDLIHHVDPQVVESAQLRLACCSVMAEMNTKRKWEQREEDRPEHDS